MFMKKQLLAVVALLNVFFCSAQVVVSESFDGTTFLPTGWALVTTTAGANWTRVTSGTFPTISTRSGAGMAKFNSWDFSSGVQSIRTPAFSMAARGTSAATVSFWMYRDGGYSTTPDRVDVLINTSLTLTGATLLGTINRSWYLAPSGVSSNGWYQYTFSIPLSFTGATNYIFFRGTSAYGNNVYIDDISYQTYPSLPGCTGTPTPGNTLAASTMVCSGNAASLSLQFPPATAGNTYQWQSAPDVSGVAGTYTNISGATLSTASPIVTATTWYRCLVTCTSSGQSSYSTPVKITLGSYGMCGAYCAPTSSCAFSDYIANVSFAGVINNSTTCATGNLYTTPVPNLTPGTSYPLAVTVGPWGQGVAAWIDFNQNGTFETSEFLGLGSVAANATASASFPVPTTATAGVTRMRVRCRYAGTLANTDACLSYSDGETEDYLVNIISLTPCTTPSAPSGLSFSSVSSTGATASFTPPGTAPSGYILVASTGALVGSPTTGQAITTGTAVGSNGTIVGSGTGSPISTSAALTGNTNYTITVFSYNNTLCTGPVFSSGVSGTFTTCPNAPAAPTPGSVTGNTINISWSAPAAGGGAYGSGSYTYLLNVYTDAGLTTAASGYPTAGTTVTSPYTITGLSGGTQYWFTIKAVSPACTGNASGAGTATTVVTPCSGTPVGGITATSAATVIGAAAFNLSVTSGSGETGLSYQWQRSSCLDSWVNIGGATGATLSTTTTASNYYRRATTCIATGLTSYSVPVYVKYQSTAYCMPVSSSGCSFSDGVTGFTLTGECGSTINNTGLGCFGNSLDRTTTIIRLKPGKSYTGSISVGYSPNNAGVWIDFNDNGSFEEAEKIWTATGLGTSLTALTLNVPTIAAGATHGVHRMRVYGYYFDNPVSACTAVSYGNYIDYTVQILPDLVLTSNSPVCAGGSLTLTATPSLTCGAIYTWAGLSGYSNVTTNTNTVTPTLVAGTYSVSVSVNGVSSCASATTPVIVNPLPSVYTVGGSGAYCSGGSGVSLTLSGSQSGVNYALKNGATTVDTKAGTGSALTFAAQTTAATYTVLATNSSTGCTNNMSGSGTVSVNALPSAITVTGGGTVCFSTTLSASNGGSGTIYYQGTNASGTSTATPSTTANITTTGTYYFRAQSAEGCWGASVGTAVTVNTCVDVSDFNTLASNTCPSASNIVTVNSSTLLAGTYTVTYTVSGANTLPATTVAVTMASGTGTFTIPGAALATAGTNTVTVTTVTNSLPSSASPSTGNTAAFTVNALPATVSGTGAGTFCGSASIGGTNGSDGSIFYQGTTSNGTNTGLGGSPQTVTASGTYYFRARSAAGCWGNQGSVVVSINLTPDVSNFSASSTTPCVGNASTVTVTSTSIGAGTYTIDYSLGGANTATSQTVNVTIAANTGTFTVPGSMLANAGATTLTVNSVTNSVGCSSTPASNTSTISVNALPVVTSVAASTSNLCIGSSVTFTASGASGTGALTSYNWSGPNSYSANTTINTATVTATTTAQSGAYSVSVTYPGLGCTSAAVATSPAVTVNALPTISGITASPVNLCIGSEVTLTAGTAIGAGTLESYNWTGPNSYSATTTATSSTFTATTTAASGNYSLSVTYPGTGCTSAITGTTTAVTVNALPTVASITPSVTNLCIGAPLTLTAGAVTGAGAIASYNWSGPNGYSTTTLTGSATFTTTTTAESGSYSVSVTYAGTGCTSASVQTSPAVTVNALPTVSGITSSTDNICIGSAITFTAGSVTGAGTLTSYNWSGPNSFSTATVSGSTGFTTSSTAQSGVYSLTVTYPGLGCTSTVTQLSPAVTVNALPTIASISATPDFLCVGADMVFTAGSTTGAGTLASYNWTGPNSYSTTTTSGTATLTASTTAASGVYSLSVTYPGTGCTSAQTALASAVTVNAVPTVASITPSTTNLCIGAPITFTAGAVTGSGTLASYNWSGPNGFSTTTLANSTSFTSSATAESGVYSLSVTYSGSGCSSSTVVTSPAVTVNAVPTVASITPSSTNICIGSTLSFTAGAVTGAGTLTSYNWTGPNGFNTTTTANNTSFTTAATAETGDYTVTVTYPGNGCTSTMAVTSPAVTVNALPTISGVSLSPNFICVGADVTLTAGTPAGAGTLTSYNWTGPNGYSTTTSAASVVLTTTTTASSGNYSLTVTYPGTGCTSNGVVTPTAVTVNALPTVAGISPSVTNLCIGSPITFTAGAVSGAGTLTSYNWSGPNSFSTTTLANNTGFTASTTAQSGVYSLTVTYSPPGCTSTVAVTNPAVTVNALPTVAAITPSTTNMCIGATVTLNAGTATGAGAIASYNWTGPNGFSAVTTGGSTSRLTTATADGGVYSVSVTYPGLGCTSAISNSPSITVNNIPTMVSIGVSPTTMCAGAVLSLTGNGAAGTGSFVRYNWSGPGGYTSTNTTPVQLYTVPASSASGVYSVTVTYTGTGCNSNPVTSTPVTVNPLPTVYNITGGGFYCSGEAGVLVGLENSDTGISYQLYNGSSADGVPMAGTGAALDFGLKTAAGTYSVIATNNITSCTTPMGGNTAVSVGPVPTQFAVTGGGGYCAGGTGVSVGMANSEVSVGYQLYRDGVEVGSIFSPSVAGPFSFGTFTATGTYTVRANPTATCNRNMSGSATIFINPLPVIYTVSGGGGYCAGSSGVHITQNFSTVGINYQLYNGALAVGSPLPGAASGLDFGLKTTPGTYSVVATNVVTGCTSAMSGTPVVSINPLPVVYNVTGGGSYCAGQSGVAVGLSNSESGINYQLYNGSTAVGAPVSGVNASLSFGVFTASGTYSVRATNATTGCVRNMSGTASVVINPLPAVYTVSGGGSYCAGGAGVHIGMNNTDIGINYHLYNGVTPVVIAMPGAAAGIDFGFITGAGTYTVLASNAVTGCVRAMSGSATVVINPLPAVHTVIGGGTVCEDGGGVPVGISGSNSGITYQLYNGASAVGSAVAGTSMPVTFGYYNIGGTYSVQATITATGCSNNMSGNAVINVNPAPTAFSMTGGGGYCAGGSGLPVGIANSQTGVSYQLYNGAALVGSLVAGTGSAITFGTYTAAGSYSVLATNNTTMCTRAMTGAANIIINPLPVAYNITGGGNYCAGTSGVNVGISNSESGISYQLYNGATADGTPFAGTGTAIDFGFKTADGTYSVLATNTTTGCTNAMNGTATVLLNALPTAYNVGGGGFYCSSTTGSVITLSGSQAGINYRLYFGGSPVGSSVSGTGSAISMAPQTAAGTYSILATDATSACSRFMTGTATIGINTSPTAYNISGGGNYCSGGTGVNIGLLGSASGINYQLYRGTTPIGAPVAGTGFAISFGSQTVAGTYTVMATNGATSCSTAMTGTAVVAINPTPLAQNVSGGGSYCAGGTGVTVGLAFANSGVNYQLYNGSTLVGAPVTGANSGLSFGLQTAAGTYSVVGTDVVTGCANNMTGTVEVVVNPLPVVQTVTGGGAFCSDASGVAVGLSSSQTGVNYQLYVGSTATGMPIGGTGSAISFGNQTVAGTYSVFATNATTGCVRNMSGTAVVIANPAPVAYNVTGGGTLCAGQPGYTVGLSGSQFNVIYTLYNGSTSTGISLNGTGAALNFGTFVTAGIYTVSAVNTGTGCAKNMNGGANIIVNPLPSTQTVTGGGAFCIGGTGVAVGLSGTQPGVNYTLYRGATLAGGSVAGTGGAVSFGIQTVAGTYTVLATNATTGCIRNMTGSAGVTVNALPAVQSVTGGGSFCAGGLGVAVGLNSSEAGVAYQLYNGATTFGSASPGTGSAISFGNVDVAGTYTVFATNYSTGCANAMGGSATVIVNDLPTAYTLTGGGSYCSGASGVAIGLSGSQSGISYQLYNGATVAAGAVAGTGTAISFGNLISNGAYTVMATNTTTGCTRAMTGSSTVTILPLPVVHNVTGGGNYCVGGPGVNIGLSGSNIGVDYQLYNGATAVGTPFTGSGMTFDFGLQTALGTYTVLATNIFTGCSIAMNGSTTIGTTPLPVTQTVTGGGSYCQGGVGVVVGLSSTETGINYQLYRGASVVGIPVSGTGSSVSFGFQSTGGTYTVLATNATTGCTQVMTGAANVVVNSLPLAYTVTGGGNYCTGGSGVAIGLSGSVAGTTYQLYNGSTAVSAAIAGTGSALSFGSIAAAGTYTVRATNTATGCAAGMTGSVNVNTNPQPTVVSVTGGGSYCAGGNGVDISLSGSSSGVNYALYRGAALVATIPGTGSPLTYGLQTTAGTYSVVATNATTGCVRNMAGNATVTISPVPVAQSVTGGGNYCVGGAGLEVGISSSEAGVSYQLFRNGVATGSLVAGTGASFSFGSMSLAGTYSVSAVNAATGCVADMSGTTTIVVNNLPMAYTVTGGGSYCQGGAGVAVGLSNTETGVSYQLYNGATVDGAAVAGTGSSISFGFRTAAGTYSVIATNSSTSCQSAMAGTTTIGINPLPAVYTVTGGGNYCAGGTGVAVGLNGSGNSIAYQLYNGSTPVGSPVTGAGSTISFGNQTAAGTYTVLATNTGTGCSRTMSGNASININSQPVAQTVTGGGAYCAGGNGVVVGLAGSGAGIAYQLYYNGVATGAPVGGTGAAITFGLKTAVGSYSVAATNNTTGCTASMTGAVTISVNALPLAQTVNGGGAYCAGGVGVPVNIAGSQTGVLYQLYNGATTIGASVNGTGGAIAFGLQTVAGSYSVLATSAGTGCTRAMTGAATVIVNPAPQVYNITGGGSYCSGGNGVIVGLSGSSVGTTYRLYNGTSIVGTPITGTGAPISFGLKTVAGTYSVVATSSAGCIVPMANTAVVTINNTPIAYNVTGGGNYCTGDAGVSVGLSGSSTGISYQLYLGSSAVGAPIAGNGSAIDFGVKTAVGTYSVMATDVISACQRGMSGVTSIGVNSNPVVYNVGGGGSYCVGGNGVAITLSNSQAGISYQLYNGSSVSGASLAGNGAALNFGLKTVAGTYTVRATNTLSGCVANMAESATISVLDLPVAQSMTGGGNICTGDAGVPVGIGGSVAGIQYQLYRGAAAIGTPVAGTGSALSFGSFNVAGVYSVVAVNATSGCTSNMTGTATINVNTLPTVQNVTGGGSYCAGGNGVYVSMSGSQSGVNYMLYNGTTLVATVPGTGSAVNFGRQTAEGMYSVVAVNAANTCSRNMAGTASVAITNLPVAQTITGGGNYCTGTNGAAIGLASSQAGISYQLFVGSVASGSAIAGSGSAISFGSRTQEGTYTVKATDVANGCINNMSGTVAINALPLPDVQTVNGGGSYCAGGSGRAIGLGGSQIGVSYTLYQGAMVAGTAVEGTGAGISFGLQTVPGTYSVVATNNATGCARTMAGTTQIAIDALPADQTVSASASSYCAGGNGVMLTLAGSQSGVTYTLMNGATTSGSSVLGTGSAISFGNRTNAGTYTVRAINNITGCVTDMTGTATISINPLPAPYSVTGGGSFCAGGTGVPVGLSSSESGVNYSLRSGTTTITGPVSGTGDAITFGSISTAGNYNVIAINTITGCSRSMSGTANVAINQLPSVVNVTGGGSYCAGGNGVQIGISSSTVNVAYQLYKDGTATGLPLSGTGSALDFGLFDATGVYTVQATNTLTACTRAMTGAATVSVNTLPEAVAVTGGGNFCAGGAGVPVGIVSSANGISYRLFRGSVAIATAGGNGSAVTFGTYSVAGTYSVSAVNTVTGCAAPMTGSVSIAINQLPTVQTVTGGGNYCTGGTGVAIGLGNSQSGVQYQLYQGTTAIGGLVSGTGSAITFGEQVAAGTYTVMATNSASCSKAMSGAATVGILPTVPVTVSVLNNGGANICAGTSVTFTTNAVNAGTSPVYTWLVNGTETAATPSFTYMPDNGDIVSVRLVSSVACASPSVATSSSTMAVVAPVVPSVATTADKAGEVCRGTSVTFTANVVNGGSAPSYSWMKNGIFQAVGATYTTIPDNGDVVYCMMTSNAACRTVNTVMSNEVTSSVVDPLNTTVQITTDATVFVEGQPVTFTAILNNAGISPEVQWLINGNEVPGANTLSFVSSILKDLDTVSVRITTSGPCGDKDVFATLVINMANVGVATVPTSAMNVRVVPNPSSGTFVINGSIGHNMNGVVTAEVVNMLGQTVYTGNVRVQNGEVNHRVSLDNSLANGAYMLRITNGINTEVIHITVSR
jgi:hypothetical protein